MLDGVIMLSYFVRRVRDDLFSAIRSGVFFFERGSRIVSDF